MLDGVVLVCGGACVGVGVGGRVVYILRHTVYNTHITIPSRQTKITIKTKENNNTMKK